MPILGFIFKGESMPNAKTKYANGKEGALACTVSILCLCILLAACTPSRDQMFPPPASVAQNAPAAGTVRPAISTVDLKSLPDTIGLEHSDRLNRLDRLAKINGISPPKIDDMAVAAGRLPKYNYTIPVARARFDERVFFDFNKDNLKPESRPVIDLLAENMKRDVPDVQLTILGHTDAVGSDEYNITLSYRRAANVMTALMKRGVRPDQLSTTAIGKAQPIAPNWTEEGRARNRRVEFMFSAQEEANFFLVSKRRVVAEYLCTTPNCAPSKSQAREELMTLKPKRTEHGSVNFAPVSSIPTQTPQPLAEIKPYVPPRENIHLIPLKEYHQMELNNEFEL
jgi:outer membrane protein OmpA-like peptidoglycan-associated protein